jgi:biotin carboxylase
MDRVVSFAGSTVLVVGAGYPGKRRAYQRMAELGVSPIVVDEPGHWSESLVADGLAAAWLPAPVIGDADEDAAAIVDALDRSAIRADGVFTIWENSVCVAARVAEALGLPGNPPESVDAARSKIRTRETALDVGPVGSPGVTQAAPSRDAG